MVATASVGFSGHGRWTTISYDGDQEVWSAHVSREADGVFTGLLFVQGSELLQYARVEGFVDAKTISGVMLDNSGGQLGTFNGEIEGMNVAGSYTFHNGDHGEWIWEDAELGEATPTSTEQWTASPTPTPSAAQSWDALCHVAVLYGSATAVHAETESYPVVNHVCQPMSPSGTIRLSRENEAFVEQRMQLTWDTAALPDDAIVVRATVGLPVAGITDDDELVLQARWAGAAGDGCDDGDSRHNASNCTESELIRPSRDRFSPSLDSRRPVYGWTSS
ncbi:MAG TPA: hypothetical protein VEB19_05615 [Gemmatimonadaceae bacterium]|nr:hypothetical protein [Gemmatimonadaceae bacterium]